MIMNHKKILAFHSFLVSSVIVVGCGSGDGTTEETTTTTTTTTTETNSGTSGTTSTSSVASADSLDDLKISTALALSVPSSLRGSSTALALAPSSNKSREACEVGRLVDEGLQGLASIANMFCHFEVEAATIAFGKKYNITMSGGDSGDDDDDNGAMSLWIDNSDATKLKVSFCEGGKLAQVINIDATNADGGSKGSVIDHGSRNDETWSREVKFDVNYTKAGDSFVTSKDKFSRGSTESFKRQLVLNLSENGVSKIFVSNTGTWQSESFSHAGAARVNDKFGQVLFKSAGEHQGQAYDWTHRASFNSNGFIVPKEDSADLATGGSLFIKDADVPKLLTDAFTVADFAATEWDCSGGEDLVINMAGANGAAHQACETDRDDWVDCWGDEYAESEETHEIDESQQKEHDQFDDHADLEEI